MARSMSHNVQRLETRRQARMPTDHVPPHLSEVYQCQCAIGAVYPGARVARGSGNHIVTVTGSDRAWPASVALTLRDDPSLAM